MVQYTGGCTAYPNIPEYASEFYSGTMGVQPTPLNKADGQYIGGGITGATQHTPLYKEAVHYIGGYITAAA